LVNELSIQSPTKTVNKPEAHVHAATVDDDTAVLVTPFLLYDGCHRPASIYDFSTTGNEGFNGARLIRPRNIHDDTADCISIAKNG